MEELLLVNPSDPIEVKLCKQLWAAVFELAVHDIVKDRYGARQWMQSYRHEPGSFTWLCEVFGYDPDYVKRIVKGKYK